jgi:hypothetical protein
MLLSRNLGGLASLALVAQNAAEAILVPPSMATTEMGDDNAMETLAINPFKRTVALECPGCAFAAKAGNALSWAQGAGNAFVRAACVGLRLGPANASPAA